MVRIISALILAVTAALASAADAPQLVDNPPDRHVVVKGDTLWGISGKFLKEPWRWPEIWEMNRDQIKNPHLIYPGDVVYLDRSGAKPRLRLGKKVSGTQPGTVKLQPQIHSEGSTSAIPSIPPHVIEPFISRPLVLDPADAGSAVRIVATQEERVMLGSGDVGFASNIADASVADWNVFRPGKPMIDPETGAVIGQEAFYLGRARLIQPGEPATLRITEAKEEIFRGDQLLPAPPATIPSFVPRRPDGEIAGSIMTIYGDKTEGGTGSVISINRGRLDGLEVGNVVALWRVRVAKAYDAQLRRVEVPIPDERYAVAFVFRTFDRVAYALVMSASKSVHKGDIVRNP
jgi:hypothetical protein